MEGYHGSEYGVFHCTHQHVSCPRVSPWVLHFYGVFHRLDTNRLGFFAWAMNVKINNVLFFDRVTF